MSRPGARTGIVLPPSEVARRRAIVARQRVEAMRVVSAIARQAALEAGLSVSPAERAIRFPRHVLERMLYLNCRYGSAALDTATGKLRDPA